MNIHLTGGLNLISIGYTGLGCYYKLNRPVSLLWNDCEGSVGQYLSLLPSSADERALVQQRINANLFEDFTGREQALYEMLSPLFSLFQNGDYTLYFDNGRQKRMAQVSSGTQTRTYEMKWHVVYPDPVDLSRINEIKKEYAKFRKDNRMENYPESLVGYTSTSVYQWEHMFYVATRPQSEINPEQVAFFREKIQQGERPFIITVNAFYAPEAEYSGEFILDGHHKLEAYRQLDIDPPCAGITFQIKSEAQAEFDIQSLSRLLYPWQTRHILDHWDEKEALLPELMEVTDSPFPRFIRHGDHREYHDNGQLRLKGFFVYERPEGLILEYYESGRQKSEKVYADGKQVGVWKDFLPSGQLRSVQSFNKLGQRDGESLTYNAFGVIQAKSSYKNGVPADGYSYANWGHTGNRNYEFWHKDGKLLEQKTYSDDGGLIRHERFSAEQGEMVEVPVSFELQHPRLARYYQQRDFSLMGVREIVILVCLLGLVLLKCLG